MKIDWKQYDPGSSYDELISVAGQSRTAAAALTRYLASLSPKMLDSRQDAAERAIAEMGITFTVYSEGRNIDRAWPFDIIPRTIAAAEWDRIAAGLTQRLTALNLFIDDLYNDQRIIRDSIVPEEIIATSRNFLKPCIGARPAHAVWANICGTDLVRDADGTVYVLEDNLRVPSGVSYMLENRIITKRVFPELFKDSSIRSVDDYASELLEMLSSLTPRTGDRPEVVVLTPGIYN
ncbi:MAG: circularly permuted type 2 ATP-grasp protein, partial [Pseudomonadales bacterium]|nr:circularly permuted type 2 ATP-grasp protein [Pseudomonadales bacterium]